MYYFFFNKLFNPFYEKVIKRRKMPVKPEV